MSLRSHGGYPDSPADVDAGPRGPGARSPEVTPGGVPGSWPSAAGGEVDLASPNFQRGGAVAADGGILRKKLYNQNLSDWSARYRKNKQHLDSLCRDCELLRADVARQQQEVDERADSLKNMEDKFQNEINAKYQETKANYEMAMQQKGMLTVQISENRKHKQYLQREKKMLTADFERKHAELMRMTEVHDKLGAQLDQFTQQLGHLNRDRHRMERELDEVNHNLKAHSELADEVNSEINHVQDGIKDSMDLHMTLANDRHQTSTSSRPGCLPAELPPAPSADNAHRR